jgi:hypothetical protein
MKLVRPQLIELFRGFPRRVTLRPLQSHSTMKYLAASSVLDQFYPLNLQIPS